MKLDNLAHRSIPTTATTAGWVMPSVGHQWNIVVEIRNKDYISQMAIERGLPRNTKGISIWDDNTREARIIVPPLNNVEDMEIWRHEIRHAIEGHWH